MFTNGLGYFYEGDCVPGDREATEEEVEALNKRNATLAQKAKIKELLSASDLAVLRCFEKGLTLNEDWQNYRAELRSLLSADFIDLERLLPARPAYQ
jgi:hypothetical protein